MIKVIKLEQTYYRHKEVPMDAFYISESTYDQVPVGSFIVVDSESNTTIESVVSELIRLMEMNSVNVVVYTPDEIRNDTSDVTNWMKSISRDLLIESLCEI